MPRKGFKHPPDCHHCAVARSPEQAAKISAAKLGKPSPKRVPVAERFWDKVAKGGPNECWEWTAYRNPKGYGVVGDGKHTFVAHRVAHELAIGSIPAGRFVLHVCDNPPCCNPKHLFLGTIADNNNDRDAKGRGVPPPVDHHWSVTPIDANHCKRGHERTPANTYISPQGIRACTACRRLRERARH